MASDVSQLSDLLAQTKVVQLNEVNFKGKGLKLDSSEDAKEIVDAIRTAKDVEALRLEGNTVGVEAAKAIADALKERKEFQKAFWSDMFTGRLRSEIPPSLECLGSAIMTSGASLTVLDLSDNAFGPDGVKGIKNLLMSRACYTLEVLKLNNNGLGIGGGKLLSQAFLECHKRSVADGQLFALKVFISGRNRLENEGAKALAAAFKVLGSLEEIQMPQNGILHPGITALGDSLAYNTNLKVLNLNDNTCTEKGAAAIAKILPKLNKLETLNLGDCLLRNAGAVALAEGLKSSTPLLKELIVSFNEIRREGGLAMCDSLAEKNDISLFNIDGPITQTLWKSIRAVDTLSPVNGEPSSRDMSVASLNPLGFRGLITRRNQLGESSAEVEAKMQELGKEDVLTPFEDNEEPDSGEEDGEGEEEEEDEEEEEEEEGEENEENQDSEESKTANLVNGFKQGEVKAQDKGAAVTFLQMPSTDTFNRLPNTMAVQFIKEAAKEHVTSSSATGGNSMLDKYVDLLLRVTSLMCSESKIIGTVTDSIFPDLLEASDNKNSDIAGAVLVRLGLIKSENKINKVIDAYGPLQALIHAAQQSYWPPSLSEYFIVFLSKPNKILDHYSDERHHLLQKLYQK